MTLNVVMNILSLFRIHFGTFWGRAVYWRGIDQTDRHLPEGAPQPPNAPPQERTLGGDRGHGKGEHK